MPWKFFYVLVQWSERMIISVNQSYFLGNQTCARLFMSRLWWHLHIPAVVIDILMATSFHTVGFLFFPAASPWLILYRIRWRCESLTCARGDVWRSDRVLRDVNMATGERPEDEHKHWVEWMDERVVHHTIGIAFPYQLVFASVREARWGNSTECFFLSNRNDKKIIWVRVSVGSHHAAFSALVPDVSLSTAWWGFHLVFFKAKYSPLNLPRTFWWQCLTHDELVEAPFSLNAVRVHLIWEHTSRLLSRLQAVGMSVCSKQQHRTRGWFQFMTNMMEAHELLTLMKWSKKLCWFDLE